MITNMNSGYRGYSMSQRATQAYADGEKPLSKWTKQAIIEAIEKIDPKKAELLSKVKLPVLKEQLLENTSWHHTSSYVNKTDFYSIDESKVEELTDEAILSPMDSNKRKKVDDSINYKGEIRYLEWSSSRIHPKATECVLSDVTITEKGCFYIVTDDTGKQLLKKKKGSNGTYVINLDEKRAKEERMIKLSSKQALDYFKSIENDYCTSLSNHIYKRGRKPSGLNYENGLDKFFEVGEHRLYQDPRTNALKLETWNGNDWEREE